MTTRKGLHLKTEKAAGVTAGTLGVLGKPSRWFVLLLLAALLIGPRAVVEALIDDSDSPLTEIGDVYKSDEPRVAVVDESGREIPLPHGGWDHFKPS